MEKIKYLLLCDRIPSFKKILENRKLSLKQKSCLNKIYHYYKNDSASFNKKEIRKAIKVKRDKYSDKKLKMKSEKACNLLISSKFYNEAKTVFCYISFNKEIDTYRILNETIRNKNLIVPVIKNNKMICAQINNLENLEKNKYGIYEPKKYEEINKDKIDLAIVPALAFNYLGFRLGYGGGYYDRFLKDYNKVSIGLAFKEFLLNDLIPEEHDMPVNDLIIL